MLRNDRLKELRKSKKLLQRDIALELGIGRTTYVKYENGDIQPPNDSVIKLAKLLGCSTDYLLGTWDDKDSQMRTWNEQDVKKESWDQKEKPATTEGNELSPERQEFFDYVMQLDDSKFQLIYDIVRRVLDEQERGL